MPLAVQLRNFINETYLGRRPVSLRVGNVDVRPRIIRRLEYLKDNPHSFNQHHGCCGFAAIIMALIRSSPRKFESLCAPCYFGGDQPHEAVFGWPGELGRLRETVEAAKRKPFSLQTRLNWRENWERFYQSALDPVYEVRISVGLMILFKEWLRHRPADAAIWAQCIEYSRFFGDYRANEKPGYLASLFGGQRNNHDIWSGDYSRKRGDLAMTPPAIQRLAQFVFQDIFCPLTWPEALVGDMTGFVPTLEGTYLVGDGNAIGSFPAVSDYLAARVRQPTASARFNDFMNQILANSPAAARTHAGALRAYQQYLELWERGARDGHIESYLENFETCLVNATADGAITLHQRAVQRLHDRHVALSGLAGNRFLGSILGLADLKAILTSELGLDPSKPAGRYVADMRNNGMIVHWVYVPPVQNHAANGLEVWTWGDRRRLFEQPRVPGEVDAVPRKLDCKYLPVWSMSIVRPA